MLEAAGVAFEAMPAHLDERAIEAVLVGTAPAEVAVALACAKAQAISRMRPGKLVLGSDSLVEVAGQRFDKPSNRDDAAKHLRFFSGKVMHLHSAAALVRDGVVLWQHGAEATLHVIEMSDEFIEGYLAEEWPAVSGCVGVFRIEGRGVQLFESIEGDHFTILGMPLLPLLSVLRDMGELPR